MRRLIALVIFGVLLVGCGANRSLMTPAARSELNDWFAQVAIDVHPCIVAQQSMENALGAMANARSTREFVRAGALSIRSEPSCEQSANNAIASLGSDTPPFVYPSLNGLQYNILNWAVVDTRNVFRDVEHVSAKYGTSVSAASQLIADSDRADTDARSIDAAMVAAARSAGMDNFEGIHLPLWRLTGSKLAGS